MNFLDQIVNPRLSPFMATSKTGQNTIWIFIIGLIAFTLSVRLLDFIAISVVGIVLNNVTDWDNQDQLLLTSLYSALSFTLLCIGAFIVLWVIQLHARQRPMKDLLTSAERLNLKTIASGFIICLVVLCFTELLSYAVFTVQYKMDWLKVNT